MKMMTAAEARVLTEESKSSILQIIFDIETAAGEGFSQIEFNNLTEKQKIQLEEHGYVVKLVSKNRDSATWQISW